MCENEIKKIAEKKCEEKNEKNCNREQKCCPNKNEQTTIGHND